MLAAEHRWQDDRLTDSKPLGVFSLLKVLEVAFRSREIIAGRYRVHEEFEKDILTPAVSDQIMEEFLRLSIQKR